MNIKIRNLKEHDLSRVLEIANQSFSIPWSLKSFKNELLNPHSILKVAEFNGEIVGYIVLRKILDEAELLSIAVKPELRRKGIATELIKNVLNEVKDSVKTCFLEVRVSNKEAISFYEKIGFKKAGLRKKYYLLPEEDAIIMKLDLS
ncbi:ribosomal protein S18-alanine N-acetyltransferase [Thermodesulfovibrio yellowstonii]|uniref:[Ribosomal protein bS18]-alanine N-acetyltransferase n=1 Tax=Thermodesulfovibrio yellowstonii TaxID=28262 RepID=A0A9W6LKW2_9BACT|nr:MULTISPECIES: ribosomal protein S18-alanine N-acetyltransferase [Thermodesulfovibrio]MDI6864323.1 ribosomal protein S18-alanine N-acetyltransferase [Thermodesulfovibrio yellowstonii]GLI54049.1 ribosomal-protein-alanine acetyltransferase [Thermodesulfovibrio islandicus]